MFRSAYRDDILLLCEQAILHLVDASHHRMHVPKYFSPLCFSKNVDGCDATDRRPIHRVNLLYGERRRLSLKHHGTMTIPVSYKIKVYIAHG